MSEAIDTSFAMRAQLTTKLLRILEAIDHVEKRGENTKHNYKYIKAADLSRKVREAFVKEKVFPTTNMIAGERWQCPTQNGGTMNYIDLSCAYTFIDCETGYELGPFHSIGWGQDTTDKSPYKGMTGAIKYALRNAFLVPDESDPENDSGEKPDAEPVAERQPMKNVEPRKGGAWPTEMTGDTLKCYVLSLQEQPANYGATKIEVRFIGLNGVETGLSGFFKGDKLADVKASEHNNAIFKLEHKGKYTNIVSCEDVFPLESEDAPF